MRPWQQWWCTHAPGCLQGVMRMHWLHVHGTRCAQPRWVLRNAPPRDQVYRGSDIPGRGRARLSTRGCRGPDKPGEPRAQPRAGGPSQHVNHVHGQNQCHHAKHQSVNSAHGLIHCHAKTQHAYATSLAPQAGGLCKAYSPSAQVEPCEVATTRQLNVPNATTPDSSPRRGHEGIVPPLGVGRFLP